MNSSVEGETIEKKVERLTHLNEGVDDGADLIYTMKIEGIPAGYNVRTDRWEVATDAMHAIHKSATAKKDNTMKIVKGGEDDKDGEVSEAKTTDG